MIVTVRDSSGKVNYWSKVFSYHWNRLILMVESSKTNTLANGLIEWTSSMLDELGSKTMYKEEDGD